MSKAHKTYARGNRPRYNSKGWVLCTCKKCGRYNYVEPHGTDAKCKCSLAWTEHESIPFRFGE